MNELQVSLLVIGFLVIAGVYGFNRIQERKHRRIAEQAFPSGHEDVLLREYESDAPPDEPEMSGFRDDPRIEPVISETTEVEEYPVAEEIEPVPARELETVEMAADVEVDAPPPVVSYENRPSLDDAVDYVVQLHLGEPVGAEALLGMPSLKGLGKRVCWLGLNPLSENWEEIAPGSSAEYLHVAATLQLADRSGPLFEQDLVAFCNQVQGIADEIVAVAEFPERQAAMARAAELDKFGVEVDVLIGVNVTTQGGEPFAATKIRALAESAGMKLLPDGAFHFFDDDGAELFTLVNRDPTPFTADNIRNLSTHGITFLFDVPKVADGLRVFNQMLLMARKIAPSLGGQLVDDNRRLLNDAAIDKIRQQLSDIYAKMENQQITSGSNRALRLFS